MKKIIIYIFLLASVSVFAQQTGSVSNYITVKTLINPAFAGVNENTEINLFAKNYFLGFSDKNPGTQAISVGGKKDNYGLNVILFNDYFGSMRNTGIKLSYAYHLQAGSDSYLSIALAPGFSQFAMDQSYYIYFDDADEAITGTNENKMVFTADFGVVYFSDLYFAGIGINNLIEPNISLGGYESEENRLTRSFNLCGAYRYDLSDDMGLEPALLMNYSTAGMLLDLSARAYIKNLIWVGAGFRTSGMLTAQFGIQYKNYKIGYAFDHSFSQISSFSSGTHEIIIGYEFLKEGGKAKM